ncbi:uncharacterized protein [Spinacia oleracea]|uniref:Myb/SANT-like domain-containing protein n=1 Tax=Spinacia oleracea TaxID=3562 RepID=A0ABM3R7M7_SPIOL|nr:uncharacterized protein LOC110798504 [Spinacia oleracea]
MSSSNKDGTREVFKWSDEDTIILCEVCLTFIKDNGKAQFFKWKDIQMDVEKKIGRELSNPNCCKNKYDAMRKDWRNWKALKLSKTGLGWDPYTGKIDASTEWWQRKIKENPEYKKFRLKGVNMELEVKWESLFGDSYATGENVYVPSMDHIEDLTVDNEKIEEENVGEHGGETYFPSNQFTAALLNEERFFESFVEQASNSTFGGSQGRATREASNNDMHASKKIQKQMPTKQNSVQMKRTRRQSGGSAMLSKGISEMTECIKQMSQGSTPNASAPSSMSTISAAMQIISRMVDNHCLEKHSELWFYATTVIEDPTKREVFFSMEGDESRAKWLEYLHEKKDN